MNAIMIARSIERLPKDEQREVFDFIGFLSVRRGSREGATNKRRLPSVAPFVGMWRDRADMTDSTVWVRKQRRTGWGVHG